MKVRLIQLSLVCKKATEVIEFADVSYFFGDIGAGKSSIAHLVDFCLGGTLVATPALQSEFVEAELLLRINDTQLKLTRVRGANAVHASWVKDGADFHIVVPARNGAGEVIPESGVEVLSDVIFYIANMKPPRVRKSKVKEDSDLVRLSLRDLLWYCYLDQATMESTFFHLEPTAEFSLRNKSRDVLRYVLGFHQEHLSALERELDELRIKRRAAEEGSRALHDALAKSNIGTEQEIDSRLAEISSTNRATEAEIGKLRKGAKAVEVHGADLLREQARTLSDEIVAVEEASSAATAMLEDERRHLNELRSLEVKFRRSDVARARLRGVEFTTCPRCTRALPERPERVCHLCGQEELGAEVDELELKVAERDAETRQGELQDSINGHNAQLRQFSRHLSELRAEKATVDKALSEALREYDSKLMSSLLALEQRKATLTQEAIRLGQLRVLPTEVAELRARADTFAADEFRVRRELADARVEAERDLGNLRRLEDLFHDCLVRAKMPGVDSAHRVEMAAGSFYPNVVRPGEEALVVANHGNLSSGGKVTIFKCCFAIALHRLAATDGPLPTVLIIDTPMKNISERNNRDIFEAFYDMVYELAESELSNTQFVLIDKECKLPPATLHKELNVRYMTPTDPKHPPLIRYFRE